MHCAASLHGREELLVCDHRKKAKEPESAFKQGAKPQPRQMQASVVAWPHGHAGEQCRADGHRVLSVA